MVNDGKGGERKMKRALLAIAIGASWLTGCNSSSDDGSPAGGGHSASGGESSHGGSATSSGDGGAADDSASLTYWQDVVPVLEQHCLDCHREEGIAPFRLDTYDSARAHSAKIKEETSERNMPPWGATSDGSCNEFTDSLALTDAEIALLGKWHDQGAKEGTPGEAQLRDLPMLDDAVPFKTPLFAPERQGGQLAEFDEYRCFMFDSGTTDPSFITGYQVTPGTPEIVHHVLAFIVDPEAPAEDDTGMTNADKIQALRDASAGRDGWPCFGQAGEGISVEAAPVTWAPGQGVVEYPDGAGIPLGSNRKLIVQVHYNLADDALLGKTDSTTVHLNLASEVARVGIFALPDPLLGSLQTEEPDTLPPGLASTKYEWTRSVEQLGLDGVPDLKLFGVGPHMHQRGRKYHMDLSGGPAGDTCGVDVQSWDFHWQRLYHYRDGIPLDGSTQFHVTCDYDTTDTKTAVLPGWGTRNEMCLATLFITAPLSILSGP